MSRSAGLVREVGLLGLTAIAINGVVGSGIFVLPATVAGLMGPKSPVAYLVAGALTALVVLCFAEAGSRVALTGGPYAYVERAFGGFAGFTVGWLLWVTGTIATAAVGTIFADSAQRMLPGLSSCLGRVGILAVVFGIVTSINVLGVRFGARLNIASTIAKLLPLALLIVLGLGSMHAGNLKWRSVPGGGELTRASVFLIFVYAGIESAMVPSGEIREPARTVPRAVVLALIVVTIVYILVQVVAQGVLGPSLAGRSAPLADVAEAVVGPVGGAMLGIAGYWGYNTYMQQKSSAATAKGLDSGDAGALVRYNETASTAAAPALETAQAAALIGGGAMGFVDAGDVSDAMSLEGG